MDKKKAFEELQVIVDGFNLAFSEWTSRYDARVQFGWAYGAIPGPVKMMEIQGIDQIIYRKPPPKALSELIK